MSEPHPEPHPDPAPADAAIPAPDPLRRRGPSTDKTARTRSHILEAAMAEFLSHGFTACTMTRIAERAGVAKGTPYRYFPTKEALFLDLLREIATDPLRAVRATPRRPGETVQAYCRRSLVPVMTVIEETGRAAIARLALTEVRGFPEFTASYRREVYQPFLTHLKGLVDEAVAGGEIAPALAAHAPHLLLAPLWIGLLQNGILDRGAPLAIGPLFESQLDLVFAAHPSGR